MRLHQTALSQAIVAGHIDCAELLLDKHGWSLSRRHRTGETPLHLAVRFKHEPLAKHLVAVGGALQWDEADYESLTPVEYQKLFGEHPLRQASPSPAERDESQMRSVEVHRSPRASGSTSELAGVEAPPEWQCQTIENNLAKLESVKLRQPSKADTDAWFRLEQTENETSTWAYTVDELMDRAIQHAQEKVTLLNNYYSTKRSLLDGQHYIMSIRCNIQCCSRHATFI